jgi:predicted nuclease of predicted toxin-antitoxin system
LPEQLPKLLFDENLAARLVEALAAIYPGSVHVSSMGLAPACDRAIWEYARRHQLTTVTKDEDFQQLSVLYGAAPKVIWIRLGNCSTDDIIRLLRRCQGEIASFIAHEEATFLALA